MDTDVHVHLTARHGLVGGGGGGFWGLFDFKQVL